MSAVRCLVLLAAVGIGMASAAAELPDVGKNPEWSLAIHGGAGVMSRADFTPERDRAYRAALTEALEAGAAVLNAGGAGDAAIIATLTVLEDSPLFNAGVGAVLDEHGNARHDASIMRGDNQDAGAIAASSRIKNPIKAAAAVMNQTDNVLLHGEGADWFASQQGLDMVSPTHFRTKRRIDSLRGVQERAAMRKSAMVDSVDERFGTVGAVVLDKQGNLWAGTSTGGRTNKRFGRVGDSPIIGAGTFASNDSCAVSATGHGEWFMRYTVARDICARVELLNESLAMAADHVIVKTLQPLGGEGAVIAMAADGTVVFSINTGGMYRGVVSSKSAARTGIFANEGVR